MREGKLAKIILQNFHAPGLHPGIIVEVSLSGLTKVGNKKWNERLVFPHAESGSDECLSIGKPIVIGCFEYEIAFCRRCAWRDSGKDRPRRECMDRALDRQPVVPLDPAKDGII